MASDLLKRLLAKKQRKELESSIIGEIVLPSIGKKVIARSQTESDHFLWLGLFGWHDCSVREDEYILSSQIT